MGYRRSIPLAEASRVSERGISLTFTPVPDTPEMLIRLELMPNAVGFIPLHVSNGTDSVVWSPLVVP
jgi:hypothetical protein